MPEANPNETLVLLVNTGSPAAPTKEALKTYLAEFLGDPRVVEMPRLLWLPILHGIILRKRPEASAARYKTVWTEKGAPLVAVTAETAEALEKALGEGWKVRWAMRYGTHRVVDELPKFLDEIRPERLVVLPRLGFPTAASVFRSCRPFFKWTPKNSLPYPAIWRLSAGFSSPGNGAFHDGGVGGNRFGLRVHRGDVVEGLSARSQKDSL